MYILLNIQSTNQDCSDVGVSVISIVIFNSVLTGILKAEGTVIALEFPNLKVRLVKVILLPCSMNIQLYIYILIFLYKWLKKVGSDRRKEDDSTQLGCCEQSVRKQPRVRQQPSLPFMKYIQEYINLRLYEHHHIRGSTILLLSPDLNDIDTAFIPDLLTEFPL